MTREEEQEGELAADPWANRRRFSSRGLDFWGATKSSPESGRDQLANRGALVQHPG
jgi:hypothetical protein